MGRQLDTLWAAQLEQREPRCGTTAVRSWSTSCPHCISSSVWPPAPCWPGSRCSACSRYPAVSWRHAPSPPHLRHLPGPGQQVPAHPAAPGRLQAEVVIVRRVEARLGLAPGPVLGVAEVVAPPGHGAVPAVCMYCIALCSVVLYRDAGLHVASSSPGEHAASCPDTWLDTSLWPGSDQNNLPRLLAGWLVVDQLLPSLWEPNVLASHFED